jgi:hypothetical protein
MSKKTKRAPRANPDKSTPFEKSIADMTLLEALDNAVRVISVPLGIVTLSAVILRENTADVRVRSIFINGAMAAGGIALRKRWPRPALGMMGWGSLGAGLALVDLLVYPNSPPVGSAGARANPTGALMPRTNSADGYWHTRNSLNNGQALVLPISGT